MQHSKHYMLLSGLLYPLGGRASGFHSVSQGHVSGDFTLLANYTRAYGIRTYINHICGIFQPERRAVLAHSAKSVQGWK